MFTDGIGNEHRPVPASGTADRNRYVGFALFLVLRKKKIDKSIDMIEEFVSDLMRVHILDNGGIIACVRFQMRNKVRIRQEPDIENQIRIDRYAILEPEAHQRDQQMLRFLCFE